MKIYAVATVMNEEDIIGATVRHLLEQGIDHVLIADGLSKDRTCEILSTFPRELVTYVTDRGAYHRQPLVTNLLAKLAGVVGCADWIIPFDADEFWMTYSKQTTIREELEALGPEVRRVYARMYQYLTYTQRELTPKPLPKVAFRYLAGENGPEITNGNHDVAFVDGDARFDVLRIGELQFRSFEHFVRKVEERCRTLDPSLPPDHGVHQTRFRGMSQTQLWSEWVAMRAVETIDDPLPWHR